jgi:hypothetical protein
VGSGLRAAQLVLSGVVVGLAYQGYVAFRRRDGGSRAGALVVAFLFAWSPGVVSAVFVDGDVGRALALLTLPAIAVSTEGLLVNPGNDGRRVAGLAVLWCAAILAHPGQAAAFAIGISIYAVARMFSSHLHPLRVPWSLVAIVAGIGLAAPWLLPAYGAEIPDVPHLPDRLYDARYAATAWALVPHPFRAPGLASVGGGALLLAVLAAVRRPDPRRGAWLFTAGTTFWLALGSGALAFLPLGRHLAPTLFVPFAAFALAVAAGGLLPVLWRSRVGYLALLGLALVLVDGWASLAIARRRTDSSTLRSLASVLAGRPGQGRVALFSYPEATGAEIYGLGRDGGHEIAQGWGLDGTPQHPPLRRLLVAARWSPEYVRRMLSAWDVRYAVVASGGSDPRAAAPAYAALGAAGFVRSEQRGRYELLERPEPSARLQALPERPMAVVGSGLQPLLRAFPFASETPARSVPGNHSVLADHAAVAAFRFAGSATELREMEQELRRFVESGGRLVVDLSGMERLLEGSSFLGVRVRPVEIAEIRVAWGAPLAGLPERLAIPTAPGEPPGPWRGATYDGLGVVTAEIEVGGTRRAVAGHSLLGAGRAEFVGLNLFYRDLLAGEDVVTRRLADAVLDGTSIARDLERPPVAVGFQRVADGRHDYTYDSARDVTAVVSATWSPRWRAYVDGRRAGLQPYERLMRVWLPAGRHHLTLVYSPFGSRWPVAGMAIGAVVLAALVALSMLGDGDRRPEET